MRGSPPKVEAPPEDLSLLDEDLDWVKALVRAAQEQRFYGKLTLTFNGGIVTHVDNNRTLKPPHRERIRR